MFEVGTLVATGKYRVDRVIGQGGMGMVIGATHVQLHQRVALKFLLPDLMKNPEVVERFVREARASAQLRSEHVCRVSDVGTTETGAPYIVMELLEGRDLASLIEGNRSLPIAQVVDYILQACMGVAEAHALGIVHRDLKPGNLFLTWRPDGTPLIKVLDFGIAKAQRDQRFTLTQTATVLGSPVYMSPEQLRSSRDVDVRSDVWSLGVILYELATGRRPFEGDSLTALALSISMDPLPPLGDAVPHGFSQIVERCLAKDPAERYPDLAALAEALAALAGGPAVDRAATVSRLLRRGSQVSLAEALAAQQRDVRPVDLLAPTQPDVTTGARSEPPRATPTPTTMGGAASSMLTASSSKRRWGVIAGVSVTVLIGAFATMAIMRGGAPAPRPADINAGSATVGSAGVSASPPPVTAAGAVPPIEAGLPPVDAAVAISVDAPGATPAAVHPAGAAPKSPGGPGGPGGETAPRGSDAAAPKQPVRRPNTPVRSNPGTPSAPVHPNPPPGPKQPVSEPEDFGATRK